MSRRFGFLAAAVLSGAAVAQPAHAQVDPAYQAVCDFIEAEDARIAPLVDGRNGAATDKFLYKDEFYATPFYMHQADGAQVEYSVNTDGKTVVWHITFDRNYIAARGWSAARLATLLKLKGRLPAKLETGCDAMTMTIASRKGQVDSIEIWAME